jgi:hypothetical protein
MRRSTNLTVRAGLWLALVAVMPLAYTPVALADKEQAQVTVADAFLDMRTGPGRAFPVFYVVERGASVQVLKRRTDWFKLRTAEKREGWVHRNQMLRTLQGDGELTQLKDGSREEFAQHRWEMGVLTGDLGGARVITAYGAWAITDSLSLEVGASHVLGSASNSYLASLGITHVLVPEWRVAPFFMLGTGVINVEPKATLVQTEDRTDQIGYVGGGIRAYLTQRFMLRFEYKSNVVFTSRDDNEEIDAWQGGFAFFF